MMTDPIADMLTRIRNAAMCRKDRTVVGASKIKVRLAEILKQEGFIHDFSVEDGTPPQLTVVLKYGEDRRSAFIDVRRASRPGRRLYINHTQIPHVQNGMGVAIISTSQGVMTDREARVKKIGGELLCEVW